MITASITMAATRAPRGARGKAVGESGRLGVPSFGCLENDQMKIRVYSQFPDGGKGFASSTGGGRARP